MSVTFDFAWGSVNIFSFPYKIGYDCAGVVTETGRDVQKFKIGDAVYIRLPEAYRGKIESFFSGETCLGLLKRKRRIMQRIR